MTIIYFSLTAQGNALASRLAQGIPGDIVTKETLLLQKESLAEAVGRLWAGADGLVFIMASGIVVRTIAPLLSSKTSDPGVVVMDLYGRFAVSLLSGHLGGANALARRLSAISGGQAVITTGTDVAHTVAFDVFAKARGFSIENIGDLKYVSSAMIEKMPVRLFSPWPGVPEFPGNVRVFEEKPAFIKEPLDKSPCVFIGHTYDEPDFLSRGGKNRDFPVLYLRPGNLYIGVGCKKNVDCAAMVHAFEDFFEKNQINAQNVAGLATIDLKKDEPAIALLCEKYHLGLSIIDKEIIGRLEAQGILHTSDFVRQTTGVGSVSEGCALGAAMTAGNGRARLVCPKTKYTGITFALAEHTPWSL